VFGRISFRKVSRIDKKKCSISMLRGEIEINKVDWLLKGIFCTIIWYVIWLRVEIKEGKLNCGCCV